MQLPDFTVEHLKQLPLRAIVAFAARCARRVEPLAQGPEGDPSAEGRQAAIKAALRLAEDFAAGSGTEPDPAVLAAIDAVESAPGGPLGRRNATAAAAQAAHAAVAAWNVMEIQENERHGPGPEPMGGDRNFLGALEDVAVDLAALDAFTAAVEAYSAVGYHNEEFVAAALNDYDRLLRLGLGRYPDPGEPIDPSPAGPLGRL